MARENRSSLRMEFEYELRNNAKVTSSSSDGPEKIGIFSLTCGQNRPIGGDDCNLVRDFRQIEHDSAVKKIYLDKVIDYEPVFTAQLTDTSSKS